MQAQAPGGRPKLVVGIVVDQLRTDYIEYLQKLFGENGFKKLMRDGAYMRDVDFGVPLLDKASGTAMVYTGAYPAFNGVPSSSFYDPATKKRRPALLDDKSVGNYTDETLSPKGLRLSTVSDELAVEGAGTGAVYSIATDPQQAIIMAGHAGNSAVWLNENNGKWASTTYYRETPVTVNNRNYGRSVAERIDTMQWRPVLNPPAYPGTPAHKRQTAFQHSFPSSDRNLFRMFSATPLANEEVTDIAIDYLRDMRLGNRGDAIDMLNIGLTAAPYKYVNDGDFRTELADSYLRLDMQLGRLFDAIDRYVGLGNTVIFLTGTGYYDDAVIDDPKYRIPTGDFSSRRALSLLNSYFCAKYGNGDYVDALYDGHLYLDHANIETKDLDPRKLADESRDFLCRMSGVHTAYSTADIIQGISPELQALRRNIDPKTAGDVYVEFAPGWNVAYDNDYPADTQAMRTAATLTPAFIMAPGLAPQTIGETVDATALAPTVSRVLRIRSPNGAHDKPLALD